MRRWVGLIAFGCPPPQIDFTAVNTGPNPNGSGVSVSASVAFSIANAQSLVFESLGFYQKSLTLNTAFNNFGGIGLSGAFDWGLPFFFGRTVFVGIDGQSSAAGTGPYLASISPDCTYQLNASGQAFPAGHLYGFTGTIQITAPPDCAWTVYSHSSQIFIPGRSSGIGNGTLSYTINANTGGDWSGSLTITVQTFTVEQNRLQVPVWASIGSMAHLAAEEKWKDDVHACE